MAYKSNQTTYVLRMKKGKIDSGVNRVNRDMFLYYFKWQEQNFLSVFTMISFFLCFFTVLIDTNWELKICNHPFHLLLICNMAFSLIFIYLFFRKSRI